MPLNNFGYVAPCLARGGQPDERGFGDLWALGFDLSYKLNDEAEFSAALEAKWFRGNVQADPYPTFDPSPARVRKSVEQIQALIAGGALVFVHCTYGRDRTGLVIGAYRLMVDRWPLEAVNAERELYGVLGLYKIFDEPINACLCAIAEEEAATQGATKP